MPPVKVAPAPAEIPAVAEETPSPANDGVMIVCVSDRRPWTHKGPLEKGEQATVPRAVAEALKAGGFVVTVGG
ncbi:MAG: hypothetical protein K2Q10_03765 [Rhodospirillales bacterium]|nr:hypothetical protein [Rhodospirillales bacterium]